MQLLIDTATETPKSLLVASRILSILSAEMHLLAHPADDTVASINGGDGGEITLTTTETPRVGDTSHTVSNTVHQGPATVPLNATFATPEAPAAPDAAQASRANPDPNVVFGRFDRVPAGTSAFMPAPASGVALDPTLPGAPAAPATNAGAVVAAGTLTAPPAPITQGVSTADKAGIAWDARVHSETRKTNADGTWRFRRNLDEATKNAVMAELKANATATVLVPGGTTNIPGVSGGLAAGPLPGQLPLSPETPPMPGYVHAANTLPTAPNAPPVILPGTLPLPAAHLMGVPDAPNPPVVPAPVTGFRDLMSKINIARSQGRLTQEQVDAACKAANVGSITELAAQPALVPAVNAQVDRFLGVAA